MGYTNKTQATEVNPESYLKENYAGKEKVQSEALALIELYSQVTGSPCVMWNKIFGFGKHYYQDSTGGEHTYLITGFAISSTGFTLYNMIGWEHFSKEIEQLGKFKLSGKSCLAIKSIEHIDLEILKSLVKSSCEEMKRRYKTEW